MPTFFINSDSFKASNAFVATLGAAPGSTYLGQILAAGLPTAANAMLAAMAATTAATRADAIAANLGLTGTAATTASTYLQTVAFAGAASTHGQGLLTALDLFTTLQNDATFGTAATAYVARVNTALSYSSVAANNSTDLTTLAAAVGSAGSSGAGSTFTLTTNTDAVPGTSGNDTIVGTNLTLTTADSISGGAGTDTLNVTLAAAANPLVTLSGVENVNLTSAVATLAGPVNATNWTGVEKINISGLGVSFSDSVAAGTSGNSITNLQNNVILGLTNAKTADNDAALFASFAAAKVTAGSTLTLDLNGVTGTTATTGRTDIIVDVSGTGTVDATRFTKLAITGSGTNVVRLGDNLSAFDNAEILLTSITVSGSGNNNFLVDGTDVTVAGVTTVNAGAATGTFTTDISASTKDVTFTGSAGKNTITFGNANNTITGGAADDSFTLGTGNNTVAGGAGNDRVIGTIASFTSNDSIDLGDGTRDAIIYTDVTALNSTGVVAANKTILGGYKNIEVVGSSANAVTAIDAGYFTQTVYELSGTNTAVVVTNVANDTFLLKSGIVGATGGAGISFAGSLPNQTLNLEVGGAAGLTFSANATAAGDTALTIASGISTVNLVSSTSATTGTITNTFAPAGGTATHTIDNASAGSFVLTGSTNLTITKGVTAGFTKAVDFNASAFTGKLSIDASASADVITGGSGADTITALGGDDSIVLTAGGADKVVFSSHTGNGKDTITGFSGDTLNVAALGDGTIATAGLTVTSAAAQRTLVDDTSNIINATGAAASITTGGTKAITDFTNLTQVAEFLAEGFLAASAANTEANVFVFNVTGTNNTYVYSFDSADANTTIAAAEVALVAVIDNGGTALTSSNIVYA